jgi:hypothetical protein
MTEQHNKRLQPTLGKSRAAEAQLMQRRSLVDGVERVLLPRILDLASATRAARAAVAISCFIAGIIVLLVLTSLGLPQNALSRPPAALIEAGLWLAIAFGIYKMSRVAAVAALALLLYNVAWVGGVFSWPSILFSFQRSARHICLSQD